MTSLSTLSSPNTPAGNIHVVTFLEVNWDNAETLKNELAALDVAPLDMVIILAPWNMGNDFKLAIELAGWRWIFHGSKYAGHLNVPQDMKGAVVIRENTNTSKAKLGAAFDAMGIKYNFKDITSASEVWIHPLCKSKIFEYANVPFNKVLEWNKNNHTAQQLTPVPREYSNPNAGTYMTTEGSRMAHMARRATTSDDIQYANTLERALNFEADNDKLKAEIAALKAAAAAANGEGPSSATSVDAPAAAPAGLAKAAAPASGKRARAA